METTVQTSASQDIQALNEKIKNASGFVDGVIFEMSKVIIGQKQMTNSLLIGLLSNGHILLEGVPGLAKTLAITTLAKVISVDFNRIQFTPDLLPADVLGTMIYNQKKEEFLVKKGPIFSNFILADEINRAPAKVQSALLEAMQEKQVTIGEKSFKLADPFLVLATQNPVEQEGTYPLPEAQVDRFMLKVVLDYPKKEEEKAIIRNNISVKGFQTPNTVIKGADVIKAREIVKEIYLDEKIEQYVVDIVSATRNPENYNLKEYANYIDFGASPRAGISMAKAAKASAFINKRGYVIPEDIRFVAKSVLRHRIGLSYEAEADNITTVDIIDSILNNVEIP